MADYKFYTNGMTLDNAGVIYKGEKYIPLDPANTDYQEYIKWCNGEDPYTEKGITEEAD